MTACRRRGKTVIQPEDSDLDTPRNRTLPDGRHPHDTWRDTTADSPIGTIHTHAETPQPHRRRHTATTACLPFRPARHHAGHTRHAPDNGHVRDTRTGMPRVPTTLPSHTQEATRDHASGTGRPGRPGPYPAGDARHEREPQPAPPAGRRGKDNPRHPILTADPCAPTAPAQPHDAPSAPPHHPHGSTPSGPAAPVHHPRDRHPYGHRNTPPAESRLRRASPARSSLPPDFLRFSNPTSLVSGFYAYFIHLPTR